MFKRIALVVLTNMPFLLLQGMEQPSYIHHLPPELKVLVLKYLSSAGDTDAAVKSIKLFLSNYPEFNNKGTIGMLIEHLASQFKQEDPERGKIIAAVAFGTEPALEWLKEYINKSPEAKAKASEYLFRLVALPIKTKQAQEKRNPKIKFLLQAGVDTDFVGPASGATLLMKAAQNGNKEIVEELIKRGVKVNATDKQDRTALDYAKRLGLYLKEYRKDVIQLLKEHGAQ
jgi:hypothetical protein